jgi:hypothetical protein
VTNTYNVSLPLRGGLTPSGSTIYAEQAAIIRRLRREAGMRRALEAHVFPEPDDVIAEVVQPDIAMAAQHIVLRTHLFGRSI